MNSDTKFPHPIPPFRYPVPPPDAEPDDSPFVQVCVNFTWMAYIIGALKTLMLQATWIDADPDAQQLALQRTELLLGMFMQAADGCNVPIPNVLCISGTFADQSYGYVPAIAAPCSPNLVNGVGWEACDDVALSKKTIDLLRVFTASTFVRSASFRFQSNIGDGYSVAASFFLNGTQVAVLNDNVLAGGGFTLSGTIDQQADSVVVTLLENATGSTNSFILDDWELCYTGDFPLSVPPETWTHVFDFTVDDGSPVFSPHAGRALYVAGVGWQANPGASVGDPTSLIQFDSSTFDSTVFTSVTFELDAVLGGRHLWQWFPNGTDDLTDSSAGVSTVTITHTDTMVNFFIGVDSVAVAAPTLTKITFTGIGTDPF